MLYLLDANVLIDANRDYYPLDRVPEFWDWLHDQGAAGAAKVPIEIFEEVKDGGDQLASWMKDPAVKAALLLDESATPTNVTHAVHNGYAADLTDDELEKLGRDPFLVAYGLIDTGGRCIVTTETSKPRKRRANRKIPDVCADLGIAICTPFHFARALDFSTAWRRS